MSGLAPPDERWQRLSAYFLALTMSLGVLVMFFPGRWINPSLFQIGLFLLGSVWTVAFAWRPFKLHLGAVLIPLAATVGWGLLQLATGSTVSRWDTWMAVLGWTGNLAACFLAMQVSVSGNIRRAFLDTLLTFAFLLSLVSVVQYFSSEGKIFWFYPSYEAAVLGPFVSRDRYAAFMEMLLPLAIMRTLAGGRRSLRFAVMGAAMYASVIAGASRAGALLTTAEIIVVPLMAWRKGSFLQDRIGAATTWKDTSWSSPANFGAPAWSTALGVPGGTPQLVLPPELAHWDVSAIPEPELALARTFIANRGGYTADARRRVSYELANRIWPLVAGPSGPMSPEWFLEAVLLVKAARS